MTVLLVLTVLAAFAAGCLAGTIWQASRTAHLLARMTPERLRLLAERTSRLRH